MSLNNPTAGSQINEQQMNANIEYAKQHALIVSEMDKRAWELVTKVPCMKTVPGYGCAVANLLIAGLGTVICAFLTDKNINKT